MNAPNKSSESSPFSVTLLAPSSANDGGSHLGVSRMREILRPLCLAFLVITFAVGQYLGAQFWPTFFSYSIRYHPHLTWTLGWLAVFVGMPTASLGFAALALASDAWKTRFRRFVRFLSAGAATVVLALLFANDGDSFFFWICIILPFTATHLAALIGFSASMPTNRNG